MRFLSTILTKVRALGNLVKPTRRPETPRVGRGLRKLTIVGCFLGCTALAFWFGRQGASQATANGLVTSALTTLTETSQGTYQMRVVAEIYGNVPITREDLGEYLIARFGTARVDFLVNRKIVEKECKDRGVYVTDGEVDAQLKDDIKGFNPLMTETEFVNSILKRFNKTLYEWKEDVIRPKLALAKICRPLVKVEDKDLRDAYEARFGPKVEVRIVVFEKDCPGLLKKWEDLRTSEERFSYYATNQFLSHLGMNGGKVPPIHKHFPDPDLEKIAFSLNQGEVSVMTQLKDGTHIVMKCDKKLPADQVTTFEQVRLQLEHDMFDQKLAQKIPEMFNQMRQQANAKVYLRANVTQAEIEQAAKTSLGIGGR